MPRHLSHQHAQCGLLLPARAVATSLILVSSAGLDAVQQHGGELPAVVRGILASGDADVATVLSLVRQDMYQRGDGDHLVHQICDDVEWLDARAGSATTLYAPDAQKACTRLVRHSLKFAIATLEASKAGRDSAKTGTAQRGAGKSAAAGKRARAPDGSRAGDKRGRHKRSRRITGRGGDDANNDSGDNNRDRRRAAAPDKSLVGMLTEPYVRMLLIVLVLTFAFCAMASKTREVVDSVRRLAMAPADTMSQSASVLTTVMHASVGFLERCILLFQPPQPPPLPPPVPESWTRWLQRKVQGLLVDPIMNAMFNAREQAAATLASLAPLQLGPLATRLVCKFPNFALGLSVLSSFLGAAYAWRQKPSSATAAGTRGVTPAPASNHTTGAKSMSGRKAKACEYLARWIQARAPQGDIRAMLQQLLDDVSRHPHKYLDVIGSTSTNGAIGQEDPRVLRAVLESILARASGPSVEDIWRYCDTKT